MIKIILALTLLLAPFFLHADIFDNVDLQAPEINQSKTYRCIVAGLDMGRVGSLGSCESKLSSALSSKTSDFCGFKVTRRSGASETSVRIYYTSGYMKNNVENPYCATMSSSTYASLDDMKETSVESCPPPNNVTHTIFITREGTLSCAMLSDIQSNDSCGFNDIYSNPVTEPNACIVKSDGSQCGVSAVDIGGGKQAYMPNENGCYSDIYPILDEHGGIGTLPDGGTGQQCTESAGLQYCPANADEVCPDGQCDAGCGNMNGVMICVSPIELPCTGDDCDTTTPPPSECTGDDCTAPPSECTGSDCDSGGGTGKGEFCDTEGNCSTGIVAKTEPSEGLKGFWKSAYPDGVKGMFEKKVDGLKQTEFYTFLQEFQPDIDSGSAPMFNFCFNFGSFGNYGCMEISIDPRVFPALKIFILISAGFACRIILFGG